MKTNKIANNDISDYNDLQNKATEKYMKFFNKMTQSFIPAINDINKEKYTVKEKEKIYSTITKKCNKLNLNVKHLYYDITFMTNDGHWFLELMDGKQFKSNMEDVKILIQSLEKYAKERLKK